MKQKYKASVNADREFYRAIRKVAVHSAHIVERHATGATVIKSEQMMKDLKAYAEQLGPWAERQSARLLERVSKSNSRAFKRQSKAVGRAIQTGFAQVETGAVAMALMNEQVALIKSIPVEAGLRAQRISMNNIEEGRRAVPDPDVVAQLKEEMGMTEEVAVNRAKLIARTETARSNAYFVQTRAQAIGVKAYVWRASMDGATRDSHAEMDGEVVRYDEVPTLSDGTRGHAGTFPNCRCWQDPVLPD